jgi:hypothetical protein
MKLSGRRHDILAFRRELSDIQSPVAGRIFILVRAARLTYLRAGESIAPIAAADMIGIPLLGTFGKDASRTRSPSSNQHGV